MMYNELIEELRRHHCDAKEDDTQEVCEECAYDVIIADKSVPSGIASVCVCGLMNRAADAIEELADNYVGKWIKIESRPMTEEERKERSEYIGYDIEYEDAIIYTSRLPDDGQEVLVCNKYGSVWIDTFDNDPDYGVGFETNGDMDGIVAWMPTPKPYKPPKEET